MKSALYSLYVIDGVPRDLSPARILGDSNVNPDAFDPIVDESTDPGLASFDFHSSRMDAYAELVNQTVRAFPKAYSGCYSRLVLASSLMDFLWREGDFKIGDVALSLEWGYDDSAVGNMAALYESVEAASEYADGLGIPISSFLMRPSDSLSFKSSVALQDIPDDEYYINEPYRSENPSVSQGSIPSRMVLDPQSWLVFIPFDMAEFRLGGSLLAQAAGNAGGPAPQTGDVDYFLDCYEVVRELVQDGILMSGVTVGEGGLMKALQKMAAEGASVDISDMASAVGETNPVKLMFSEIPGVLIQIHDSDFDYLDAELLLQDVAFYPLGHPVPASGKIDVNSSTRNGIHKILESLIQNQGAEGED